jgi:hypothetical protein
MVDVSGIGTKQLLAALALASSSTSHGPPSWGRIMQRRYQSDVAPTSANTPFTVDRARREKPNTRPE